MEDKVKYQLRHLVIPAFVYADNRLNWTSGRIYAFIHSYTNPFFFSNDHLGKMFNVNPQTISNAVAQLEELKYIKTEYRVKADGGKTRLCVDLYSDYKNSYSGDEEKRGPTISKHSDKDIKENNIKENFGEKDLKDGDDFHDFLRRKKERKAKKQPFGYSRTNGYAQNADKPKKRHVDLTDIV